MPSPPPEPVATPSPSRPHPPPPSRSSPLPPLEEGRAAGLDKRSAERLKRGQYAIEARIDLHGMTQERAHAALLGFVERSARQGLRCLLVITGKGLRDLAEPGAGGRGVLRQAVPRWLNEPPLRARILAFSAAQPRDGGNGALYLLLRRPR